MEKIILITVLATLGIVALVTAIVVMFNKLRNKVDVNNFEEKNKDFYLEMVKRNDSLEKELSDTHQRISYESDELNRRVDKSTQEIFRALDELERNTQHNLDEIRRFIDSRCDKLDSKIKHFIPSEEGHKKILTD